MTIASWPSSLPPLPLRTGFEEAPKPAVIEFEVESGPGKRRTRSSIRVEAVSMSFDLTAAQRTTFRTFFYTTLDKGALPFSYTHPVEGTVSRWRFAKDAWRMTPKGIGFTAACKLERLG